MLTGLLTWRCSILEEEGHRVFVVLVGLASHVQRRIPLLICGAVDGGGAAEEKVNRLLETEERSVVQRCVTVLGCRFADVSATGRSRKTCSLPPEGHMQGVCRVWTYKNHSPSRFPILFRGEG